MVETGPVQQAVLAQDQRVNGQASNEQVLQQTIPSQVATHLAYFGGGSVFQAMAGVPTEFKGFYAKRDAWNDAC